MHDLRVLAALQESAPCPAAGVASAPSGPGHHQRPDRAQLASRLGATEGHLGRAPAPSVAPSAGDCVPVRNAGGGELVERRWRASRC